MYTPNLVFLTGAQFPMEWGGHPSHSTLHYPRDGYRSYLLLLTSMSSAFYVSLESVWEFLWDLWRFKIYPQLLDTLLFESWNWIPLSLSVGWTYWLTSHEQNVAEVILYVSKRHCLSPSSLSLPLSSPPALPPFLSLTLSCPPALPPSLCLPSPLSSLALGDANRHVLRTLLSPHGEEPRPPVNSP